jgi:hypothetical protein
MAAAVRPSRCVCATATAAPSRAIGPAPKSPHLPDRWYFCEPHAAEYNRGWNYFEGLSAEQASAREADERRDASGFTESRHHGWAGPGDGTRTRDEMRALDVLSWNPMWISPRSRPPTAASPSRTTPI